jgi:uncharacterized membrane protein YcjF (UPF0283 family)
MSEYTCRHCGMKFDRLYLGLMRHIQDIHPSKFSFDADIKPYYEAAMDYEDRHIQPQVSPAEKRARRKLFWIIVIVSMIVTFAATVAVMTMKGDNLILAGITALVWVAWIFLSCWIIKGLAE